MKAIPFLTARWTNLAMLTYAVPPAILEASLPPACELDTMKGNAFVTLVAFDFKDTRVLGMSCPGYRDFAEVNLRFYVRHGDSHGVCFLREFVGKHLVAGIARAFYNEPFQVLPVRTCITHAVDPITVQREITLGNRKYSVRIDAAGALTLPAPGSCENFVKEQEWGFGANRRGELIRYRVQHPLWKIHPVRSFHLDWDWQKIYGPRWAFLQDCKPVSVMLVAGSAVQLFHKGILRPVQTAVAPAIPA